MAENPIYVSIEIRPYLVDYFKHYFGEHPIKVDESSKLLQLFHKYLTHFPPHYKPLKPGPKLITFELPYNKVIDIRKYNYISPVHFPEIQSWLYGMFYNDFILYMNEQCLHSNLPIKSSIITFMESNDISFDRFQYDSLKRLYYRYRIKTHKNRRNNLSA